MEVFVDTELQGCDEGWLSDEDKVVVFGEVFEQQAKFA